MVRWAYGSMSVVRAVYTCKLTYYYMTYCGLNSVCLYNSSAT